MTVPRQQRAENPYKQEPAVEQAGAIPELNQAEYILLLTYHRDKMRYHNREAAKASAKWERLNEEVNAYLEASGITDVVHKTRIKEKNLALAGAFDAWHFHQREVMRHAASIGAEETVWETRQEASYSRKF